MRVILLLSLLLTQLGVSAQDARTDASMAYREGRFEEAKQGFEELVQTQPLDASLHYNLGCAAYRSGDVAGAMVAFLRAQRLDPGNEDIAHNLSIVRSVRTDKIDALPPRVMQDIQRRIHRFLSADAAAWISLGLGCLLVVFLLVGIKMRKGAFFSASWLLGGLLLLVLLAGAASKAYEDHNRWGVLIEASAYLKAEPSDQSLDLLVIHTGTELKLLNADGEWTRVQLADGRQGWILSTVFEEI